MAISVLIADDHPFTRAGIRAILEADNYNSFEIVGEARDGQETIEMVKALRPDIVIMDVSMPNLSGIEATKIIMDEYDKTRVVALSIHTGERYVKNMLDAGAMGYLLKDEAPEELIKAIQKVEMGEMFLSSAVTRAALQKKDNAKEVIDKKVLLSKLHRPPIAVDYVLRTGIIHELESNVVKPLSIISAGAGYGKSITVSQWLEQTKYLKCWISLDEDHNDFRTFLYYLIVSIEKVFPGLLKETRDEVSAPLLPPVKELSNTLINELCNIDTDLILVLDDYHLIKQKKVHDLLDEWLKFPPPKVHLCLITRLDPPLKIRSLISADRITEIRMNDLSFTNEEIIELFKHSSKVELDGDAVENLQDKTEGWIISLRLISMLVKNQEEVSKIAKLIEGGYNAISEYLLAEVLSSQTKYVQDQLLTISVLHRFCMDLVEEVISTTDQKQAEAPRGDELIHWLLRMNMFLIPLDIEQKWFRYHHLFQGFLQGQLKKHKTEEEIAEIHTKASKWFEENGYLEEAIDHAMKAGEPDLAKKIISENWEVVSDSDDFLTVDKWLSYLPEEVIQSSTNLLFARFYSIFKGHRLGELPGTLGLILQSKDILTDSEKGYLAFINSMINYYAGDGHKSLSFAKEALKYIPEQFTSFRGDARTYWFISMLMIGKNKEALQSHRKNILKYNEENELVQLGRLRTNLGFYALFNADLPLLKETTLEMSKTPGLSSFMLGFYLHNLQYLCWFQNDFNGVIRASEEIINVRYEYTSRLVIDCYIMKALSFQGFGKTDLAEKTLDEAMKFADYVGDPVNNHVVLSGRAHLKLKQGDSTRAYEWLENSEHHKLDATMLWCVEVPAITRCRILLHKGEQEDLQLAMDLLKQYEAFSKSVHNKIQSINILILQVLTLIKLEKEKEAIEVLKQAIEMASKGSWAMPFVEHGNDFSELFVQLKEDGMETKFVNSIFDAIDKERKWVEEVISIETSEMKSEKENLVVLTPKEQEVLNCIAEGLRNQEIANKLFNTEDTIKKHIYHMFQKLNVKNRMSLVTKAREEGILID